MIYREDVGPITCNESIVNHVMHGRPTAKAHLHDAITEKV